VRHQASGFERILVKCAGAQWLHVSLRDVSADHYRHELGEGADRRRLSVDPFRVGDGEHDQCGPGAARRRLDRGERGVGSEEDHPPTMTRDGESGRRLISP
jgi:hypothetical protein